MLEPVREIAAKLVLAALLLATSGCMSMMGRIAADHGFGGPPYIGVRIDLHVLRQDEPDPDDLIAVPASLVDLPFSFLVDSLALPIDLCAWAAGRRIEVPFVFDDPYERKDQRKDEQ